MTPRRIVTWSLVLGALILGSALATSRRIGARLEKGTLQQQWTTPVSGAQTLVSGRFQPGGPELLAILATSGVRLVSGDGKVVAALDVLDGIATSATGDMDADGADEVWIVRKAGSPYAAEALGSELQTKLRVPLEGLSLPVRILPVDLDGDGRCELVAADDRGNLRAYDRKGATLWTFAPPLLAGENREIRGLDDVRDPKGRRVAIGYQDGYVAILDRAGHVAWRTEAGKLRRLRSFDVDGDGNGDVVLGTDSGQYLAYAALGRSLAVVRLDEAVTEIRPVEVDGDPTRSEVFLGGKKGAYSLLRGDVTLARGALPGRVSSARGIDTDGDGRQEIFVGTENGRLFALLPDGREVDWVPVVGKVESMGSVTSPLRDRLVVATGPARVSAFRFSRRLAPGWYNPWTAAVLGWLVIASVATVLLRLPPEAQPTAPRPAPEPAHPRAQALEAAADRIASWIASGKLRAEEAEDRLQQIRRRIAESAKAKRAPTVASPPPPRPRG